MSKKNPLYTLHSLPLSWGKPQKQMNLRYQSNDLESTSVYSDCLKSTIKITTRSHQSVSTFDCNHEGLNIAPPVLSWNEHALVKWSRCKGLICLNLTVEQYGKEPFMFWCHDSVSKYHPFHIKTMYLVDIGYQTPDVTIGEQLAVLSCQGLMNRENGSI